MRAPTVAVTMFVLGALGLAGGACNDIEGIRAGELTGPAGTGGGTISAGGMASTSSGTGGTGADTTSGGAGGMTSSGGSAGAGGTGGSTTTTTTGTVGCTAEATFNDCRDCFAQQFPEGAAIYMELVVCVICDACYTSCDGGNREDCLMPPATKDACDTADMPNDMACDDGMGSGCIPCALVDPCQPALSACQVSPHCQDFATAIQDCPN